MVTIIRTMPVAAMMDTPKGTMVRPLTLGLGSSVFRGGTSASTGTRPSRVVVMVERVATALEVSLDTSGGKRQKRKKKQKAANAWVDSLLQLA